MFFFLTGCYELWCLIGMIILLGYTTKGQKEVDHLYYISKEFENLMGQIIQNPGQ